jgi:hypothetical protein
MSGSLTVIGGVNNTSVTGLVTIPAVLPSGSVLTNLQNFLSTVAGGAVTAGGGNFQNLNAANMTGSVNSDITVGSGTAGLLDITNTNSTGGTTAGAASVSFSVPGGYNYVVVQAPGHETVTGNGSTNFLATFGSLAGVTFNTGGGSGTVAAGGPSNFTVLEGNSWSYVGSGVGGETVAGVAGNSTIEVFGTGPGAGNPSNVVALDASSVTAVAGGSNDLIESFDGTGGSISVTGGANVLVNGGSVSVYATAGMTSVNAFFEQGGGQLYFVNNSTVAATVSGSVNDSVSGGRVTAFGGAGGGVYVGGLGGNNSLVGGTGLVTLYGAGANSTLTAASSGGDNVLFASEGEASSGGNIFQASTGSTTAVSYGTGTQQFFAGVSGQDVFTGSLSTPTVPGQANIYYFNQDSTGSGSDIITNFRVGTDALVINGNSSVGGVSIASIQTNGGSGGGVIVSLSDNTTIKLYGVALSAADAATASGGVYQL